MTQSVQSEPRFVSYAVDGPVAWVMLDRAPYMPDAAPPEPMPADNALAILPAEPTRLRVLSCNILAGGSVRNYREYVTHSWKHVVPVGKPGNGSRPETPVRHAAGGRCSWAARPRSSLLVWAANSATSNRSR